jgi:hypothetical protein
MGTRYVANLALNQPSLRFSHEAEQAATPARVTAARRAIAQENHAAALQSDDVRWMFAQQVQSSIEGGRAAIVRPQVRQQLVADAQRLGLRPFDANLVIAIAQDAARHGEDLHETAVHRLAMVPARHPASKIGPLMLLGAAVGLAAGLVALFIAWIMG